MTNTALFTEILNRCGEGYEGWTERAKAAFKSTIIEMVKSDMFHETEYPGLIFRKEVTGLSGASVAFSSIIQSGYEFIRWLSFDATIASPAATKKVQIVSYPEYQAYVYNPSILGSSDTIAYETYTGSAVNLTFSFTVATGDKFYPAYVAWYSGLTETASLELSPYFSDIFLETAIQLSVKKLTEEIEKW